MAKKADGGMLEFSFRCSAGQQDGTLVPCVPVLYPEAGVAVESNCNCYLSIVMTARSDSNNCHLVSQHCGPLFDTRVHGDGMRSVRMSSSSRIRTIVVGAFPLHTLLDAAQCE